MKNIAFISGPALGHVGRLFQIANQLEVRADVNITFYIPAFSKVADFVIGKSFKIIKIPIPDKVRHQPFGAFADQMETHFNEQNFDLIVHDGCPLRWTSALKFPDCPRILITNVFLTGHHTKHTVQTKWFKNIDQKIHGLRKEKNLSPISTPFELYNADKVLLADPQFLFQHLRQLPDHFEYCGPIIWGSDDPEPAELSSLENFLIISMGSTGRRELPPRLFQSLKETTQSSHIIYAGQQHQAVSAAGHADFCYEWLPLSKLFARTKCVLSQGGTGSTYQALSQGVPVMTFPTHINQEILGNHIQKKGFGSCIGLNENLEKLTNFDIGLIEAKTRGASSHPSFKNGPAKAARQIMELL